MNYLELYSNLYCCQAHAGSLARHLCYCAAAAGADDSTIRRIHAAGEQDSPSYMCEAALKTVDGGPHFLQKEGCPPAPHPRPHIEHLWDEGR